MPVTEVFDSWQRQSDTEENNSHLLPTQTQNSLCLKDGGSLASPGLTKGSQVFQLYIKTHKKCGSLHLLWNSHKKTSKNVTQRQLLKKQVRKSLPERRKGRRRRTKTRQGGRQKERGTEGRSHSFDNFLEKEIDSFVTYFLKKTKTFPWKLTYAACEQCKIPCYKARLWTFLLAEAGSSGLCRNLSLMGTFSWQPTKPLLTAVCNPNES